MNELGLQKGVVPIIRGKASKFHREQAMGGLPQKDRRFEQEQTEETEKDFIIFSLLSPFAPV